MSSCLHINRSNLAAARNSAKEYIKYSVFVLYRSAGRLFTLHTIAWRGPSMSACQCRTGIPFHTRSLCDSLIISIHIYSTLNNIHDSLIYAAWNIIWITQFRGPDGIYQQYFSVTVGKMSFSFDLCIFNSHYTDNSTCFTSNIISHIKFHKKYVLHHQIYSSFN